MELSHISKILFREEMKSFDRDKETKEGDEIEPPKDKERIMARRFDPMNDSNSGDLCHIFTQLKMDSTSRADYVFLAYKENENDKKQITFFLIEKTDLLREFQNKYLAKCESTGSEDVDKLLRNFTRERRKEFIKKFVGSVEILCCLDGVCTQLKDEKTGATKLNAKELRKFIEENKKLCQSKINNLCRGKHITHRHPSTNLQHEDDQCWLCKNWHPAKTNGDKEKNKFFYTVFIPTYEQKLKNKDLVSPQSIPYSNMCSSINRNIRKTIKRRRRNSFVSMIGGDLLCSYEIFADKIAEYKNSTESL